MPAPPVTEKGSSAPPRRSLWARFFKPSNMCVGLDVGSFSVKAVLVARSSKGYKLLKAEVHPFPSALNQAKKAGIIQNLMRDLNPTQVPVVTALSGPGAVLRLINLPRMNPQELRASLEFEAEKYIPFKLKETSLDFVIRSQRDDGRMDVFLAASRKDIITLHLDFLRSAKVVPAVVDLEALALGNAWEATHPQAPEDQVTVIIHIGARGTILSFVVGSQFQFTREIPMGGEVFTQAIVDRMHISRAQAEELKCEPGERAAEVQNVLQTYWEEWLNQCRVSFDFYENQFSHHLSRLSFSGGSAKLMGFRQWVEQTSGLPTEEWNPIADFVIADNKQQVEVQAQLLSVAVGLAVRELPA